MYNNPYKSNTGYRPAITTKEITGMTIETIPVGTKFTARPCEKNDAGYSSCNGLDITLIWNTEYEFITGE